MKIGRAWLLAAGLAGASCASHATTFSAAIGVSNLTKAQERRFEQRACLPHGVALDAAQGVGHAQRNDFKLTMVTVRCMPHRYIERQPVAYEVYCRRAERDRWDCSHAEEKLFARINGTTFSVGVNHEAVAVDEAYRVFRFLVAHGQLQNVAPDKPFDYREDREVAFDVWKDEGDRIFAHCDRYLVLTRLAPGRYQLDP
jgi:hypothetical protein